MMLKINTLILLVVFPAILCFGQKNQYKYTRDLAVQELQWHRISLPDEIWQNLNKQKSDIRIKGITTENDTIEAPYIWNIRSLKENVSPLSFKIINTSRNEKGFYYTFELSEINLINQIILDFDIKNFDWKTDLEGSENQKEWFTLLENYRILSIKNDRTDFHFTTLDFPPAKYKYFRLRIHTEQQHKLLSASVNYLKNTMADYKKFTVKEVEIKESPQEKNTVVNIALDHAVPVSRLTVKVKDKTDYFRNFQVSYLTDSSSTDTGWKYHYSPISSGILSSMAKNEINFSSLVTKHLQVIIENQDNAPLQIEGLEVSGLIHELIVRFDKQAKYSLWYGNEHAEIPKYDLSMFADKIPTEIPTLISANEVAMLSADDSIKPLIKNTLYLWAMIGLIVIILGWFTLKMMRQM